MFIENVGLYEIINGHHYDAGPNSVLIQIVDPDIKHPTPKYPFKEIYKFKFLDIEEQDHPYAITDEQAKQIINILKKAKENNSNVIVHCHAGVCRSGAVVEAGVALGFDDTEKYRQPNLLVKQKLFKELLNG